MDLINFISKNFGPLNLMMERAGMVSGQPTSPSQAGS